MRPGGLSSQAAAFKLNWLIEQAFERQLTGVDLKDESDSLLKINSGSTQTIISIDN
ncbi:hypothetical protein [Staphylococcus haemolyticus]|uniref:hypothetical protein n=1 Tax=Staphylococcus haemolyticus TaxID=1283 RepID=UPI003CCFE0D8